MRLCGINFDTDSDTSCADADRMLDHFGAAHAAKAAWRIVVEGHADPTSTPAHNVDLNARRR